MIRALSFLTILVLAIAQASAAPVYGLRLSNTAVALNPGQSLVLNVFFDEIYDPGADTPRLGIALPGEGLIIANFGIVISGPGGSTISSVNGNALFDGFGGPDVTPGNPTTIEQDVDIGSNPVFATQTSPGVRSVLIGSFTVNAGLLGDQNLISLVDFGAGDDFVISDGFVADGVMSFGSATVTAVPEPSSALLLGLAGCAAGYRSYRRRKLAAKKD